MKPHLIKIIILISLVISVCINLYQNFRIDQLRQAQVKIIRTIDSNQKELYKYDQAGMILQPEKEIYAIGDTINLNSIFLLMPNAYAGYKKKPYLLLGSKYDESTQKLLGIIDSVYLDDWQGNIRIKATKVGKQTLYGQCYVPNQDVYYPLSVEYTVVDKESFDKIEKIIGYNR